FGGPTGIPLLRANPRLVVLRSFSKAMSLAGLRFGYALAHPAVAAEIAKAKLPYNVNRVTLAAAVAALDAGEVLARRTEEVRHNRDLLYQKVCAIGGLRAFPSAANFVLIRCEARPANEVFTRLMRSEERRVGKEWRVWERAEHDEKKEVEDKSIRKKVRICERNELVKHA